MKKIQGCVLTGAAFLALIGCNNKKPAAAEEAGTVGAGTLEATATPSGRCRVTSPDAAYDMLYFFPDKKEFLARTEEGIAIEPLNITTTAAGKVDFTTKPWHAPEKQDVASTQTGTLTFNGKSWSFDFSRYKHAECVSDTFNLTYKSLPELGVKPGTWSTKDDYTMTFPAEGQRFFLKHKGEESVIYYRVLDQTDSGIVIGTSAMPPSSATGDIWLTSTLTPLGDKLNAVMKDTRLLLSYSGAPAADAGSSMQSAAGSSAVKASAPAATPTKSVTLRKGAMQVNGRLPPEVVDRIVRQNFGRFRLCYENGLRSNAKLAGTVTAKFVIDRSGSVSTAQEGGSDLPDQGVVSCVVRGFGNLSFPQPEGGIVTVAYQVIFGTGD